MPPRFAFGRIAPRGDPGVAADLRNFVEIVCSYDRRVKPFLPTPRERSRVEWEGFGIQWLRRPLPPAILPDGLRPFDLDSREGGYGGSTELDGPMDARLERLWAATLQERPLRAVAGFLLQRSDFFPQAASVTVDIMRRGSSLHPAISVQDWPTEGRPDDATIFLEALGAAGFTEPEDLARPKRLGEGSRTVRTRDLPADLDFLTGLSRAMERDGWTSPGCVLDASFRARDEAGRYMEWRDAFNAATDDWNFGISGWYREGFDPYAAPPEPHAFEERRYPAAAYVSRAGDCEAPILQIDVVHVGEGSFLEFQSARGPATVRKYAELAGLDVELWKGRPADRWAAPGR